MNKRSIHPSRLESSTNDRTEPTEQPPSAEGPIIIGIDARTLSPRGCCDRGIGHYTAYHIEALAIEKPQWTFLLFLDNPEERTWALDRLCALPNIITGAIHDLPYTNIHLYHTPDVMVIGNHTARGISWDLLKSGIPYSVIFYDLIPLILRNDFFDSWNEQSQNIYLSRLSNLKSSKALILTISENTKKDLIGYLKIPPSRIVTIMAGLNQSTAAIAPTEEQISAVLNAIGITSPFFLVVGALDSHKRFETTLKAFLETLKTNKIQLVVVGSLSDPNTRLVSEAVAKRGIQTIKFTGFLSREDLECLYKAARGLAFPSAYEGFGFPVLEAMAQGCPVITSRASSLPEVAGDAALLVSPDDSSEMAKAMRRLLDEPKLRADLIQRGLEQAKRFSWSANAQATIKAWMPLLHSRGRPGVGEIECQRVVTPQARVSLRWEGSQFVYHSLAHVNRQLCLGLLSSGEAELSLIPYERDQFDASAEPAIAPLAERVLAPLSGPAQVHVRHQWPPNFTAPPEGAWVMIQPWEYGGIPQSWVLPMRELVDEIWVPSTWVKACYVESGVPAEKVQVVPNGVDPEVFSSEGTQASLSTSKRFKFLFLGGTIPRKGIDLLLEAYQQAFTAADDVCLVIKGQGGEVYQGAELGQMLQDIKARPGAPEIEYTTANLKEAELAALYRACDAFVMPYRGEGFGLPMAEAMASGKPVIATARGAAMDFLAEDRAYLIPCDCRRINMTGEFQPSAPGFWLEEPRLEDLVALLRHVASHPEEAAAKGRQGRLWVTANLGWEAPTRLILERLKVLAERTPLRFLPADARVPEPEAREAFLLQPDWSGAAWVEILLAYVAAFRPGEPVGLVLLLGGTGSTQEEAQERVLELLARAGHEAFADVEIVDQPEDMLETLKRYDTFQWIAEVSAAGANRLGPRAKRLHEARLALRR